MESIRNKSVLVVDDDPGLLRALEKVLIGEGCTVTCASWAAEAMEQLADRNNRFDLIITDLRMPFVKGNTILHAAKVVFPAVPVIIITAFGSPEMKEECLAQGAAAFLEKPLDAPRLIGVIESVLKAPD